MNNKLTSVKEMARQAIVWTDGGLINSLTYICVKGFQWFKLT